MRSSVGWREFQAAVVPYISGVSPEISRGTPRPGILPEISGLKNPSRFLGGMKPGGALRRPGERRRPRPAILMRRARS
jgi:hypothetical protein